MAPRALSSNPSAGSLSAPSPGSTAAAGSPRTGKTATTMRSPSSTSPRSASCSEGSAIPHNVSGRTLRKLLISRSRHGHATIYRGAAATRELAEMRQLTLASASFDKHSKQTRRAKFLAEMDQVVPWRELCTVVEPFYPNGENGRPPIGLERMLRLHFLQHWFNLSDPAAEEVLYDSLSMRQFVGLDPGRQPGPA